MFAHAASLNRTLDKAVTPERRANFIVMGDLNTMGLNVGAGRHRQTRGAAPLGEHLADVIALDQPAVGKPAQHPHAHLLGDGGEGLRCQVSGGAKAHGLRAITGWC
ncbi:hypothetical protein [uncultured Thiohalocapsa sp.]|uniref:hypothetical protein n=1 Tax=uncultured Thiohalocapsa sp. TaxID=768990 RepID=UPI0025FE155A|nr:hypothetical protein [uncultured Thiohalocapsa sp.]